MGTQIAIIDDERYIICSRISNIALGLCLGWCLNTYLHRARNAPAIGESIAIRVRTLTSTKNKGFTGRMCARNFNVRCWRTVYWRVTRVIFSITTPARIKFIPERVRARGVVECPEHHTTQIIFGDQIEFCRQRVCIFTKTLTRLSCIVVYHIGCLRCFVPNFSVPKIITVGQ